VQWGSKHQTPNNGKRQPHLNCFTFGSREAPLTKDGDVAARTTAARTTDMPSHLSTYPLNHRTTAANRFTFFLTI